MGDCLKKKNMHLRLVPLHFKKFFFFFLLSLFITNSLIGQNMAVNGKVVDGKNGEILIGVNIALKSNAAIGTITDTNGLFSLSVPDAKNDVLIFNYIGYKVLEVPINGRKIINVSLETSSETLDEVVVVGYGTQKKGSVIGSQDQLNPEVLKVPTRTISTSLVGNLSGIFAIQSSGEPGYDAANFWIRGINTFAGGSTPLILVDGVERPIDDIEPDEIADFTILKDATATAVYGVRGANGVVLINTKKGQVGIPKINVQVDNSFAFPTYTPKFVDGPTYMRMQNEALANQGIQPIYSEDMIQNTANNTDPYYYPNVDWAKSLLRNSFTTQHATLNISGGSENARYFVFCGFLNQNGMFQKFGGTSYNNNINEKKYNFRTNVDVNATKTTVLSVNVAATLEDRNYPGAATGDIFSWMYQTSPVVYPLMYPDKTKVPGIAYGQGRNPYQLLALSGYSTENHETAKSDFTVNQNLSFITKGLSAKVVYAFDYNTDASATNSMAPRPYLIKPYGYDPVSGSPVLTDSLGVYNYVDQDPSNTSGPYHDYLTKSQSTTTTRQIYLEGSLTYNRIFGKHAVGGLLLYNQYDQAYPSETNVYNSVPHHYQGLAGRVTYAFADKYFAEYNFGYNGSENFAKQNRYGFFPSYAIGWTLTKESFAQFMKPAVDYLKIRASYGLVGNDQLGAISSNAGDISRFVYLSRVSLTSSNVGFGTNNGYGYGHGQGLDITYYGNPNATWETAHKYNIGIDVNFLKGFNIQADYFYEKRTNIWVQLTKVPDIFGFGSAQPGGNVGEMQNKGIDGTIDYSRQLNKNLLIGLKGTFTYAKNKVLANGAETPKYAYQSQIGQSYGRCFGYVAEGLFVDQAEINHSPDQTAIGGQPNPGDIRYKDINGDGVINQFDQVYMGYSSIPEITYGIGANVAYKNFDLSFLFQGAAHVSFFINPAPFPQQDRGNVYAFIENNYWSQSTQNLNATFPRLATGQQIYNYTPSSWWLRNGRYIRLNQAELGYTLRKDFSKKIGANSIRVFLSGLNLFTVAPFTWWDPQAQQNTAMYYSVPRYATLGLQVKF